MKTLFPCFLLAAGLALLAGAGCSHIEIVPDGDPNRTVSGTLEFRSEVRLPDDAVVVVRVVDTAGLAQQRAAANRDLPLGDRGQADPVPQVLAEQKIPVGKGGSIPFHIAFTADDELLRHGVNLDARISSGGKVRYQTAVAHVVTLGNFDSPHTVWLEPTSR